MPGCFGGFSRQHGRRVHQNAAPFGIGRQVSNRGLLGSQLSYYTVASGLSTQVSGGGEKMKEAEEEPKPKEPKHTDGFK